MGIVVFRADGGAEITAAAHDIHLRDGRGASPRPVFCLVLVRKYLHVSVSWPLTPLNGWRLSSEVKGHYCFWWKLWHLYGNLVAAGAEPSFSSWEMTLLTKQEVYVSAGFFSVWLVWVSGSRPLIGQPAGHLSAPGNTVGMGEVRLDASLPASCLPLAHF